MRLRTHRWWLAAVAALFTPWIGPHISEYLPIGFLLILGVTTGLGSDRPDGAFWMIACGLVVVSYGVWFLVFILIDRIRATARASASRSRPE